MVDAGLVEQVCVGNDLGRISLTYVCNADGSTAKEVTSNSHREHGGGNYAKKMTDFWNHRSGMQGADSIRAQHSTKTSYLGKFTERLELEYGWDFTTKVSSDSMGFGGIYGCALGNG